AAGDVEADLDELADVGLAFGDELRFALWESGIALAVEEQQRLAAGVADLADPGAGGALLFADEVAGQAVFDEFGCHGVEGVAHRLVNGEERNEPVAVEAEPAAGSALEVAGPRRQRPLPPVGD